VEQEDWEQQFKEQGYKVAATYAGNDEKAKAFSAQTGIKVYKWDVSDYKQCQEGIARVEADLGGNIEILVNNAGITRDGFMHKMTSENWEEVIRTNLNSVFYMTRCVIEKMRETGFGRIINMSSVNGKKGQAGQTNYSAAKAGIEGFTKALALESAAKGVTVNAIAPGYMDTEMVQAIAPEVRQKIVAQVPVGRFGTPEEIARTAVFLANDNSSFITGAVFAINGGLYMC
jgi:acetoacetyl-CoA reductase